MRRRGEESDHDPDLEWSGVVVEVRGGVWWGGSVQCWVLTPSETPGVRSWLVLAVVFCPQFWLEYLRLRLRVTINKRLVLAGRELRPGCPVQRQVWVIGTRARLDSEVWPEQRNITALASHFSLPCRNIEMRGRQSRWSGLTTCVVYGSGAGYCV